MIDDVWLETITADEFERFLARLTLHPDLKSPPVDELEQYADEEAAEGLRSRLSNVEHRQPTQSDRSASEPVVVQSEPAITAQPATHQTKRQQAVNVALDSTAAVQRKRAKPPSVDNQACAAFLDNPTLTKTQLAEYLGKSKQSLTRKRCPKLHELYEARGGILPKGIKGRDGYFEAEDHR